MQNDKYMPEQPPAYGFTSAPPTNSNYPPQGYPPQAYPPPQGYPAQSYPAQTYPAPPPPPPPTAAPQQPQVIVVAQGGWYSRNQRNKPQSNAVGSAGLLFVSGGMNIAWSVGFRSIVVSSIHMSVCWFIGAIIGAFISGFLANKIPKKFIVLFSSLLVTIGGIILATTYMNAQAIFAALYLDGIANGLVFAPIMALAGEVSVPYMRGLITTSTEQMLFGLGIFLQIVYTSSWTNSSYGTFGPLQLHGVLSAVYGLLAMIMSAILTIESPVIMLANGQEQEATATLRRLQRPGTMSTEIYEQLAEHKLYLAQNKDLSAIQAIMQALPALLRIGFLRALNAMSISYAIAQTFVLCAVFTRNGYWLYLVFALCRWFGSFICVFLVESAGRKALTLIGLVVSAGLAAGIGSQFDGLSVWDLVYGYGYMEKLSTAVALLCIFQASAALGLTPTSAYVSECYPLGVKQHFIGFTFIIEMLVFIIIGATQPSVNDTAAYFYVMSALYLVGFILFIFCLPETKKTTLRQSQDKFRGFVSKGF